MNVEVHTENLRLRMAGLSSPAFNKDHVGTVFKLSGKVWDIVKTNQLKNKGRNIWIYERGDTVFAGIEVENYEKAIACGLEIKMINLPKYAYYRHVGPYSLIKQAGDTMINVLSKQGIEASLPYIEIYGHWTNDETTLETELYMSLL